MLMRGDGRVLENIPLAASAMRARVATVRKEGIPMAQRSSAAITLGRRLERYRYDIGIKILVSKRGVKSFAI